MPDSSDESERKRQSREVEEVHRAVAQHIGLGDEPLDRKRKKLVKGRLMDLITREVVPSAVVVAATEDVIDDDRTIRNDEVSIVPVKDIDILTRRKNSVDKMEYKNLGGNIWLKKLCQDNLEEYYNIVGNHSNLRKNIILTTIINQLANENRRVLQIRNGEWTQMKEQEVKRHIQNAMNAARINECHGSCC